MIEPTVEFHDVSLAYRLPHNRAGSLKEHVVHALRRQIRHDDLVALEGVSLSAFPGEVLGVVGPNGAGKSTMMKLIGRILPPTHGRVIVRGAIAAMIELAAGLDVELSTAENIVLYGSLLGREPDVMRRRIPVILEWAGLEGLEDIPVRTFSSGMIARLSFAVSVDSEPQILIVDEVLSVGDESFRRRSMDRVLSMASRGTTVVLVSHSLPMVEAVASRAIWLDHGRVKLAGSGSAVVDAYRNSLADK